MHTLVPLRSRPDLTDSLSLVPQEVLDNVRYILPAFGPFFKGEAVDSAIHWVTFHRTSNDVQFRLRKLDVLDIVGYGDGEVVRL